MKKEWMDQEEGENHDNCVWIKLMKFSGTGKIKLYEAACGVRAGKGAVESYKAKDSCK